MLSVDSFAVLNEMELSGLISSVSSTNLSAG